MIGAILAGVSAAGSLVGTLQSAKANREQLSFLNKRNTELDAWYNKEYNTDYLNTSEARGTVQLLRDSVRENMKKVNQGNAIKGSSDEMRIATADKVQRNYANQVTQLASHGTQYKNSIRQQYIGQKTGLDNLQAQSLQQKSNNWSAYANNAMAVGVGAMTADADGAFNKWDGQLTNWSKARKLSKAGGTVKPVKTTQLKAPTFYAGK